MALYDHGVPMNDAGLKCCARCFAPLRDTVYTCASCWSDMTISERAELQHSEHVLEQQRLARLVIGTTGVARPGGMVETRAYNPIRDVASVMANAQEKCKFGAQKELWNYIVGELAECFVHRSGGGSTEFIHWCHGGSGGGRSRTREP
jgi:hypothetical protein